MESENDTVMYKIVKGLKSLSDLEIQLGKLIEKAEEEKISKEELLSELKEIKHKMFGM